MSDGKNFWERLGLVTVNPEESSAKAGYKPIITTDAQAVQIIDVFAITDESGTVQLAPKTIEQIYANAGLSDVAQSIFKAEETMSVLPASLPNAEQSKMLVNVLKTFNLTPEILTADAASRIQALDAYLSGFVDKGSGIVNNNAASIEEYQEKIKQLRENSEKILTAIKTEEALITQEINRIKYVVTAVTI